MDLSGPGTAIMFAIAAVLWFAYLIPTWLRRREYLATERNATRIQQTLRIMAETAEAPEAVRVEATARGAAQAERMLREQERQRAEREKAALNRVRAAEHPDIVRARETRRRLRRTRMIVSAVLFISIGAVITQLGLMAVTGIAAGAWTVLAVAGFAAVLSFGGLRSLASRRIPAPVVQVGIGQPTMQREMTYEPASESREAGWVPVPVPKPLYLNRPAPQRLEPSLDAERRMREAAAAAELALRAAHAEPEVVPFPVRERALPAAAATPARADAPIAPAVPAAPSRWASMGIVDPVAQAAPDLDEVLRRRRAAG